MSWQCLSRQAAGAAPPVPRTPSRPGRPHPAPLPSHTTSRAHSHAGAGTRTPPTPRGVQAAQAIPASADEGEGVPEYTITDYTAARNDAYWERRPVAVLKRGIEIGAEFSRWWLASRVAPTSPPSAMAAPPPASSFAAGAQPSRPPTDAERMRDVLTRLGPAFIKVGQALSSRPDLMPPSYVAALEMLQDRIPPFSDADARAVIEEELGAPPSAIFASLSPTPVAAASLGQVYRGTLRPEYGGGEVAVKVQRPGVRAAIGLDVHILRKAAAALRSARSVNTDLPALVDEWAASLFRELDYSAEAANGVRFKRLYGGLEGVFVPDMRVDLTTRRVLVMEWVEGTRLRSASGFGGGPASRRAGPAGAADAAAAAEDLRLVDIGVRCSLEQMLEEGFYHSDPHPGNLLKTKDGKLAYIDFGMMGTVDAAVRSSLITACLHLVNREFAALADDFVALGLLPPGSARSDIVPALTAVFSGALSRGVSQVSFSNLSADLGVTMYQYQFRIPPYYTLLVRSLSVLEGIALAADPEYKVLGAAYPWIARRLLAGPSPELRQSLRAVLYKGGAFRFDRLESLLLQAARSPPRPRPAAPGGGDRAAASEGGAGTGSTAAAGGAASSPLALLLGPDGGFIREILIEELAKGLDGAVRLGADAALDAGASAASSAAAVGERLAGPAAPLAAPALFPARATSAVLGALPRSSRQADRDQVDGVARLARALRELSAAAAATAAPGGGAAAGPPSPATTLSKAANALASGGLAALPALLLQAPATALASLTAAAPSVLVPPGAPAATAALAWLAGELASLPPTAAATAAALPAEILAAAASVGAARALRAAAALDEGGAAAGGATTTAAPAPTTAATPAARKRPPVPAPQPARRPAPAPTPPPVVTPRPVNGSARVNGAATRPPPPRPTVNGSARVNGATPAPKGSALVNAAVSAGKASDGREVVMVDLQAPPE